VSNISCFQQTWLRKYLPNFSCEDGNRSNLKNVFYLQKWRTTFKSKCGSMLGLMSQYTNWETLCSRLKGSRTVSLTILPQLNHWACLLWNPKSVTVLLSPKYNELICVSLWRKLTSSRHIHLTISSDYIHFILSIVDYLCLHSGNIIHRNPVQSLTYPHKLWIGELQSGNFIWEAQSCSN
jgi:hypothetical protein